MIFKEDNKSKLEVGNFGAGSCFSAGNGYTYLVLSDEERASKTVTLCCLESFKKLGVSLQVNDVNWLTESETRLLVDTLGLQMTFSDFDFDAKGFKQ